MEPLCHQGIVFGGNEQKTDCFDLSYLVHLRNRASAQLERWTGGRPRHRLTFRFEIPIFDHLEQNYLRRTKPPLGYN